jgi:hypothetical protein
VVPAYNEGAVIAATLRDLLQARELALAIAKSPEPPAGTGR